MTMTITKPIDRAALAAALVQFAKLKPGFDPNDYTRSGYRAAYREYKGYADYNRAFTPETIAMILAPLSDDQIAEIVNRRYNGRLNVTEKGEGYDVDITAGQNWSEEYQYAVKIVLEALIEAYLRALAAQVFEDVLRLGRRYHEGAHIEIIAEDEDGFKFEISKGIAGHNVSAREYFGKRVSRLD